LRAAARRCLRFCLLVYGAAGTLELALRCARAYRAVDQIDFGWEICSTGGVSRTFRVSHFRIHAVAK
jgi:hypothetical protein